MTRRYLALDLGAESGRAIVAELNNHKVELTDLRRFSNVPVRLPTGLYWDTPRLFHEICESISAAARSTEELDGIAVDTWGVDFALLAAQGGLLENPRHYRDARTEGVPERIFEIVSRAEIFHQTGVQFMSINSLYQLYAAQRESPELFSCAAKLLFMPDLFNYFLTGSFVSERTVASTSQFYDPCKGRFATDMLRKLGIQAGFLPELVDPGTELGTVLPYVAEPFGLSHDTPVYATASHDTASAIAAVPASVEEPWCYISSGTWSLMGVELQQPIINDAALEANFTNEAGVEHTIRFLKNIPGLWILQECRRAWAKGGQEYSYADLMERAAAAKPCRAILDLDRFSSPGDYPKLIRDYCRETGQEIPQDTGAVVRVVLNNLAMRYKQVLEALENLTGRQIEVIHIVGGGSRNRLLNQLTADVTGRRVVAGPAEATAIGNALVQSLGAGDIETLDELRSVVKQSFAFEEHRPRGQT
ncbi:MAG TPA: rhamnulokinase family protein [Bryobacteraceae bacterium]|jgi:rhamnulokinase